jgi:hypothetical protein
MVKRIVVLVELEFISQEVVHVVVLADAGKVWVICLYKKVKDYEFDKEFM